MTVSIDQMAKNLENLAGTVTETSSHDRGDGHFHRSAWPRTRRSLTNAAQKASQRVTEMAAAVNDVAKIAEEADTHQPPRPRRTRALGDEAVATHRSRA